MLGGIILLIVSSVASPRRRMAWVQGFPDLILCFMPLYYDLAPACKIFALSTTSPG